MKRSSLVTVVGRTILLTALFSIVIGSLWGQDKESLIYVAGRASNINFDVGLGWPF